MLEPIWPDVVIASATMGIESTGGRESATPVHDTAELRVEERAAIIVAEGDRTSVYPMFGARNITLDGAFLTSPLLLEIGEVAMVELSWADDVRLRVRARVVSLDRGDVPGMQVAFFELDEGARELIAARSGRTSQ